MIKITKTSNMATSDFMPDFTATPAADSKVSLKRIEAELERKRKRTGRTGVSQK